MQASQDLKYGFVTTIDVPFETAVDKLETAPKAEGFGVLCRICSRSLAIRQAPARHAQGSQRTAPTRGEQCRARLVVELGAIGRASRLSPRPGDRKNRAFRHFPNDCA